MIRIASGLDPGRYASTILVMDAAGPLSANLPRHITVHDIGRRRLRSALPAIIGWLRHHRSYAVIASLGYINLGLLAARPALPVETHIVVREANTPSLALPQSPRPWLTRLGYRLLYRTADAVVAQHQQTAAEMRDHFQVPGRALHIIANPIDVKAVRAAASGPWPKRDAIRLVAAGRLARQKGFDRLIALMAETAADRHLTIYGDGPERHALRRQIDDSGLGNRVTLAGFTPNPVPALARADACVLSSRWEGLPNVALEALACGTPVIATPQSGGLVALGGAPGVTIVPWGPAFKAAIEAVEPAPDTGLSASLLPAQFESTAVVAQFTVMLDQL